MAKYALPLLTGGLNEVTRQDLIDDSELSQCDNYNIEGDGRLAKRRDVSAVDFDQTLSDSLQDWQEENQYSAWRVEAWSPNFNIDMTNHPEATMMVSNVPAMVVVNTETYVQGNSEIERLRVDLWYRYRDTVEGHDGETEIRYRWTNEVKWDATTGHGSTIHDLLLDAGIQYSIEHSDIRMDIAEDRVVIADGINVCHFISVDRDGLPQVGPMGFGSPKNKLRFTTRFMDSTDDDDLGVVPNESFSETEDDIFSVPGYLQATYTVVDRYGNESNPAPYSDTLHIDYFNLDESMDTLWLDYVLIKDLSIPILGSELKAEELDEFKIYFRWFRYREGNVGALGFTWTQSEKIIARAEFGPTANSYRMDMPLSESVMPISYENDPAPYAHQIASLNGISVIGDIVSIPTYPFDFKYQHPIEIKNTNNKHYVDAVVQIRLTQPPCHSGVQNPITECNEVNHLNLLDFFRYYNMDGPGYPDFGEEDIVMAPRKDTNQYIRFFDIDQTTPLQVITKNAMYTPDTDSVDHQVDLWIKIPLLPGSGTHTIYLCWTPIGPGFTTPPHPQHEVNSYGGVHQPYDWYPEGIQNIVEPSSSKDYWQHSAIYYGAITSQLHDTNYNHPELTENFRFLNFRHQRVFQSKGVWHEDVLVAAPGDANFLSDETNARMTNRVNKSIPGQFTDNYGTLIRGWNPTEANLDLNNYYSELDGDAVVRKGEARVRIPRFWRNAPPDETDDDYTERTIGYGGYITTSENYQSTLNFGDLGGIDLYNRSFTIMFNVCFLNPLHTGDPTYHRSRLVTMNGNAIGSYLMWNKLTLDVLHPDHIDNITGQDIWLLKVNDGANTITWHYFDPRGVFVTAYPDYDDGSGPYEIPEYEWTQKESDNPVVWGNPREGGNANKFVCLSIKAYERGDPTTLSLWIYDQDTNKINYISTDQAMFAGFLHDGFSELAMMGNSNFDMAVPPPDGYQRNGAILQQLTFEKDRHYDFSRTDDVAAMYNRMNGMPGYNDPIGYAYNGTVGDATPSETEEINQKIVFSKSTLIFSNRERSLLKWSAINNFSFPTLNVARLKEPITAIIPAPSFLRFKYANTFLVFTRNTIQRVQVYPDVAALASAQPDESIFQNVIAEKKNYGLLARDSLTLAGDSLYWLSEVGIVKWSGEGMEIISKNRVNPQLLPFVYGFVNPVDNQYIVGAPPDYLTDYWTPGPAPPWTPPGTGPWLGGVPCCSCCMPNHLAWGSAAGENFVNCVSREDCKARGGVYSERMCEPIGFLPWWLPPDEWNWHRCTSCDVTQPDGWNMHDWCAGIEFEGEVPEEPPGPPVPGCNENPLFSCNYDDIFDPQVQQGFDDDWWGGLVCNLSTNWQQMQIEYAEILGLSGWPYSRYSEYGAGQWGHPEQNGFVFMNFHEMDIWATTGTGTQAFYDPHNVGTGGWNDFDDPIGSCAKFNIYYPTPPGLTGPEEGGERDVWINGKDLLQRFGSINKYYPLGWSESWGMPEWHHKRAGDESDIDRWRFTFYHFGGGMAARVRDCPVPGEDGGIFKWDGPRFMHTASEVYLREYSYDAGAYNSVSGFWWIDTYLTSWSHLVPFPLEDSPYWGANRLGYGRNKNPFRGKQSVRGMAGGGKSHSLRTGRDELLYGDYYTHNLDNMKFTRYTGFNVIWSSIGKKLNGDIVNWVVDVDGHIQEWPGQEYVDYALARTKKFFVEDGSLRRVKIDYEGDHEVGINVQTSRYKTDNYTIEEDRDHGGGGIIVTPKHYNPMNKSLKDQSFSINNIQSKQWRGLAINKLTQFSLIISGADVINSIFYDVHLKSKVNIPEQPTVTYEKEGYLDPVESGRKKE